jgi:NDP-sugar pyrophosphorylase family protein
MNAILLSSGRGERLIPLTNKTQKVMLPIEGKPLIQHWIERLEKQNIKNIGINLGYLGYQIEDYFDDGKRFGTRINYLREEYVSGNLLGTATPIKKIEQLYPGFCSSEPFFVIYADNLSNMDLGKVISFHKEHQSIATITLHHHKDPWTKGIVQTDKNKRIISFIEKPPKESILTKKIIGEPASCVMLFEPEILDYLSNKKEDLGTDIFPKILENGEKMFAFNPNAYVQDIGTIEGYKKAQIDARRGLLK